MTPSAKITGAMAASALRRAHQMVKEALFAAVAPVQSEGKLALSPS
jgi:hypothetical protein